jgi:hypothetical protein
MLDRAQDLARVAVEAILSLVSSLRHGFNAWITGGDITLMVILVGVAVVLLLAVLVPLGRRY